MDILGNPLHPTKSVRNLGVWFDSDFSFSKHIQNVCKSCFVQLRDFRNIRHFLTHDAAVLVAMLLLVGWTTVTHFSGVSKFNLHRLQSIQNSAVELLQIQVSLLG